ncbi:neuropeptide Y receptor type 2-like [Babylonia areolata]|uniref:neuropeptide Y receptor type 2-like n=1 Tax=Babylonia areolata TaxID=304850 RepID=UPI003FD27D33
MPSTERPLSAEKDPRSWAHNLSLEEMLLSSGLGSGGRWFEPLTELCLVLAFSLAVLLGLMGNGLVASMLCHQARLRSPRHWYLLNLVVSDILTCVLCVPFTVVRLTLKDWRLGEVLCRTAPFLQMTYVFVSIFTILAIAVERYRSIVCSAHLRAHHRHRLARVVIPAIWLAAAALATPLAVTHRLEPVPNVTGREQGKGEGEEVLTLCVEHWESDVWLGVYTVVLLLFQYLLPAAAIMALHLLICRFLRTRVHLRADSARSRRKMARHRKNLVLLTVISVTFDVQWLPITVVNILADFDPALFPSARHFCLTYSLCLLFALTSVFTNPVVYGWYNSNFRGDLCGASCTRGGASEASASSGARTSSGALSRFYSLVVRSSATSQLQDSGEEYRDGSSPPGRGSVGSLVHRSSLDGYLGGWPGLRHASGRRAHRRSLQLELK